MVLCTVQAELFNGIKKKWKVECQSQRLLSILIKQALKIALKTGRWGSLGTVLNADTHFESEMKQWIEKLSDYRRITNKFKGFRTKDHKCFSCLQKIFGKPEVDCFVIDDETGFTIYETTLSAGRVGHNERSLYPFFKVLL